jgi:trehalose 6-phosphate synthase
VISPTDVEGTADALFQALTMPLAERRRRAEGLRRAVERDDVAAWFKNQLLDMMHTIHGEEVPQSDEEDQLPPNIVALSGTERISTAGA